jgi:hypothetical protein
MDTDQNATSTSSAPAPATNPHVLWRQLLGFVLWVGILSLVAGGPVGAALCLTLGGLTFADAWQSGIYKRPDRKTFLNISPMAWGIVMALLFIVAYPAYVLNRNKLRTICRTNAYFWALTIVGAVVSRQTIGWSDRGPQLRWAKEGIDH